MKTQIIGYAIKDSFIVIIFGVILFGIYKFVKISYGGNISELFMGLSFLIIVIMGGNVFAALGASMFGGTYQLNKEKYKYRFSFLSDDKYSSGIRHTWTMVFFMTIGIIVYPFALIYALFNIKALTSKNEHYENIADNEVLLKKSEDSADNRVKGNKKWKVNKNYLTNYYFHTYEEALSFVIKNDMDSKEIQEVI